MSNITADTGPVEFHHEGIQVHLVDGYPGRISYDDGAVDLNAHHHVEQNLVITTEKALIHQLYLRHGGDWRVGQRKADGKRVTHEIWQA